MAVDTTTVSSWMTSLASIYGTYRSSRTPAPAPAPAPAAYDQKNATPGNITGGISTTMIAVGVVALIVGVVVIKKVL